MYSLTPQFVFRTQTSLGSVADVALDSHAQNMSTTTGLQTLCGAPSRLNRSASVLFEQRPEFTLLR